MTSKQKIRVVVGIVCGLLGVVCFFAACTQLAAKLVPEQDSSEKPDSQGAAVSGTEESVSSAAKPGFNQPDNPAPNSESSRYYEYKDREITVESDYLQKSLKGHSDKDKVVYVMRIIRDSIAPQATTALVKRFPKTFGYLSQRHIGVGLGLNTAGDGVTALFKYQPMYTQGNPDDSVWSLYSLFVDYSAFEWKDGRITDLWRKDLKAQIAHEMMHGLMTEALTFGMSGMDSNLQELPEEKFPNWFVEGTAVAVGGGGAGRMRISDDVKRLSSDKSVVKSALDKFPLRGATMGSSYGTGWLATLYLSYLANGGDSCAPKDLAAGLDTILSEIGTGKSFNQVVAEVTGGKFSDLADFESKFSGASNETVDFVSSIMARVQETRGSILTDDFTCDDLIPDGELDTPLFWIYLEDSQYTNKYDDKLNAAQTFEGGGVSKAGINGRRQGI